MKEDKMIVIKNFVFVFLLIILFIAGISAVFFTVLSFIPRVVLWFAGIVTGILVGGFFAAYWIQDVLED